MKELTMEQRLMLAVVLTGLMFLVMSYFSPTPPPAEETAAEQTAEATTEQPQLDLGAADETANAEPTAEEETIQPVQASEQETLTVETDRYQVEFSNRGGMVLHWILKDYTDGEGNPLDLVNPGAQELPGGKAIPAPFSMIFPDQTPEIDPNTVLLSMIRTADGVRFQFSARGTQIEKIFRFETDAYLVDVSSRVTVNGIGIPHLLTWRGGFGDNTVASPAAAEQGVYYEGGLEKTSAGDADEPPVTITGNFGFAGIEDKYFSAVALKNEDSGSTLDFETLADPLPTDDDEDAERVGVAVGGSANNQLHFFIGPKDRDILASVDPRLDDLINWGFFGFLAKPMFFLLVLTDSITHSYGWAIVAVTFLVNLVLTPLRVSAIKSQRKMASIQPLMNAITEKYKGLPMNDPKRANQREEMQALQEAHGVSMTGGCVPMLMQMPVFLAFYTVLGVAIELRHAGWLWVGDLSQPENLAIRALPVLLVITQFLSQKMTPQAGMDPSMQKSMMFMPLVFGFMFYYQSAGLVLYWLTSNVIGIGQQAVLNKVYPPLPKVEVIPPSKKKKKK